MYNFLQNLYKQTVVLWVSPVTDGYGAVTFAAPTEIKGRWQDKVNLLHAKGILESVSNTQLYTSAVVEEENWVYLGALADLSTEEKANPKLIKTAYEVKQIEKFVALNNSEEIYRKALL